MKLVFSIHNPETLFQESDYYPFIQRLFDNDLVTLKPELTVISYNYDCYFDYLLLRAYEQRQTLLGKGNGISTLYKNILTSGFFEPDDLSWAEQTANFNYFKLHGSIEYANNRNYYLTFHNDPRHRLIDFRLNNSKSMTPPIVFPWEIFDNRGFISESSFKSTFVRNERKSATQLHSLYKEIWTAAQEKISRAGKFSFIGLSMHPYLKSGLSFLFQHPPQAASIVVANKENEHYKNEPSRIHPASLCGKVVDLLRDIAPDMKLLRSQSEDDGMFSVDTYEKAYEPDITPRYSFRDFIEREMD